MESFGKANTAKEETIIKGYKEQLELIWQGVKTENYLTNKTLEEQLEECKEKIKIDDNFKDAQKVEREETVIEVITKEGYTFHVTEKEVVYIRKAGEKLEDIVVNISAGEIKDKKVSITAVANHVQGRTIEYVVYVKGQEVERSSKTTKTNYTYEYTTIFGEVDAYVEVNYDTEKTSKSNEITIEDNTIKTKAELEKFRDNVNSGNNYEGKTVLVKSESIDLGRTAWTPIGTASNSFKGEFDGEGNVIDNLYINSNEGNQALFRTNEGTIKNVTVKGEVIGNGENIAGVCAVSRGTIESVTNYATVTNNSTAEVTSLTNVESTGGVVAKIENIQGVSVTKCDNHGQITGSAPVGGIIGESEANDITIDGCNNHNKITGNCITGGVIGWQKVQGTVQNCNNYAEISSVSSGRGGGIIGLAGDFSEVTGTMVISNCLNKGIINVSGKACAGGITSSIYNMNGNISECKNEASVISTFGSNVDSAQTGGIIGGISASEKITPQKSTTIEKCVNKGDVKAPGMSIGGMVGFVRNGYKVTINNCYNTGEIKTDNRRAGGMVGVSRDDKQDEEPLTQVIINNCYNKGNIQGSSQAGQILGYDDNNNRSINNCFYSKACTGDNTYGGTGANDESLKQQIAVDTLGEAFALDKNNINNGYIILKWELEKE